MRSEMRGENSNDNQNKVVAKEEVKVAAAQVN